jgi:hypothetical protein
VPLDLGVELDEPRACIESDQLGQPGVAESAGDPDTRSQWSSLLQLDGLHLVEIDHLVEGESVDVPGVVEVRVVRMQLESIAPGSGGEDLAPGGLVGDRHQQAPVVELDAQVLVLEGVGRGGDPADRCRLAGRQRIDLVATGGHQGFEHGSPLGVALDRADRP